VPLLGNISLLKQIGCKWQSKKTWVSIEQLETLAELIKEGQRCALRLD
jgi:hypothetical protein